MTSGYNPYTAGHSSPSFKRNRLLWSIGVIVACICLVVIYHDNRTDGCIRYAETTGSRADISYSITPPFVACSVVGDTESAVSS